MASNMEKGRIGEDAALRLLEQKGMKLVQRNVHVGSDELDLVMEDGAMLVLIEVKLRAHADFPRAAVDAAKQKRICRAALRYLQQRGWVGRGVRFDVVEVRYLDGQMELHHIPNAFLFQSGRYFV